MWGGEDSEGMGKEDERTVNSVEMLQKDSQRAVDGRMVMWKRIHERVDSIKTELEDSYNRMDMLQTEIRRLKSSIKSTEAAKKTETDKSQAEVAEKKKVNEALKERLRCSELLV